MPDEGELRQGAGRRDEGDGGGRLDILMVTPSSPEDQGGVERHVREVSSRMAASGHRVRVLWADSTGNRANTRQVDGVAVTGVNAWPRGKDWGFAPALWREIRAARPDIVHVQSYHTLVAPLAMAAAARAGYPFVLTFHGGGHSASWRNRIRGLHRQLLRPLLARASRLIAVAQFEVEEYAPELRFDRERFLVIPNGTDVATFAAVPAGRSAGMTQPIIATIGRLERYKGHHRVLAAFPLVLEKLPDARLLVVGKGPYEQDLREQADALGVSGSVEFLSVPAGDASAMAGLLADIDLVALLSEFETHPLTALEAAAAHRRLLVSDQGGLRDLAAGGLAHEIPLGTTPAEVADAMMMALSEPALLDVQLPTWDDCAGALLDLYHSVVFNQSAERTR